MSWTPSHHQRVEIANVVRGIASNLRNVSDACDQTASRYLELAPEAQAEVTQIITVARFLEIQIIVQGLQAEIEGPILAYEGEQGLPMAVE